MPRAHDDRNAFRCSVAPENSFGKLQVGRKQHAINVIDTSRTAFTVRVPEKLAKALKEDQKYVLYFAGEQWEVTKKGSYREADGNVHVGFVRVQELTKLKVPSSSFWSYVPQVSAQTDPAFLMFLILAFLFACISLPGIGDALGTAPKVRDGIHSVRDGVRDFMR